MGERRVLSRVAFEALTPRERACLRLVAQHRQSKEIALLLNISKSTVDKHIDSARARIGAANRRAAALALLAYESENELGARYPSDPIPIPGGNPDRPRQSPSDSDKGISNDRIDQAQRAGATDLQPRLPGQLGGPGIDLEPAGQSAPGGGHSDLDLGPAAAATVVAAGEAADADSQRNGLADIGRDILARLRTGIRELTPLQMLTTVALIAIVGSVLLGGVLFGAYEVALMVQRLINAVEPPRG
jgi:DNA-binding CsgD family transcriptional regulator